MGSPFRLMSRTWNALGLLALQMNCQNDDHDSSSSGSSNNDHSANYTNKTSTMTTVCGDMRRATGKR